MSKSIAQKTTKRTPAPTLSVVPEAAPSPSLGDRVAEIRRCQRGGSVADVLRSSAEDLFIIIHSLESDSNANVPGVIITRMIEVQEIMYAVVEELEAARGAA